MTQVSFTLQGHNPDVLSCIANLSNDEVFTPPAFANQMLDSLEASWAASNNGESIWANKEVTFLDPCTKSGVFLREIVKRLNEGLSKELPDLTERSFRNWHNRTDQSSRSSQCLLLKVCKWNSLRCAYLYQQ